MSVLSRRERDRLARKADILKAAEQVFALKGYHKTTMRDIAKKAEYGLGTAYLYFKDKEAIYNSLLEKKLEKLLDILKEKLKHVNGVKKRLESLVQGSLTYFQENREFFRIFSHEEIGLLAEKMILKSPVFCEYSKYSKDLLKEAQAQGLIDKCYDLNELTEVLRSLIKMAVTNWIKEGKRRETNLVDKADVILNMFLHGVAKK